MTWFLVLLAGAAVFAALAGPPLFARLQIPAEASSALRAQSQSSMPAAPELPTLRGFIVGLVPTNPIRAAADGAMLPLIVFTLLFALATTRLPETAARVTGLFRAVSQAMLALVQWILRLTPVGVFALALGMGRRPGRRRRGRLLRRRAVGHAAGVDVAVYPVVAIVTRRPPWCSRGPPRRPRRWRRARGRRWRRCRR